LFQSAQLTILFLPPRTSVSFVLFVPPEQSNIYELPGKINKRSAEIRPEFTRRWTNKLQLQLLCNWQKSNKNSSMFCKRVAGFSGSSLMGLRLWFKKGIKRGVYSRGICVRFVFYFLGFLWPAHYHKVKQKM